MNSIGVIVKQPKINLVQLQNVQNKTRILSALCFPQIQKQEQEMTKGYNHMKLKYKLHMYNINKRGIERSINNE